MDNKVTKERINNHLEYDWFKYLIIVALALFIVIFTFSQINRDKDDETFTLFYTCYGQSANTDTPDLYKKYGFVNNLNEQRKSASYEKDKYGPDILRSISVNYVTTGSSEYSQLFQTQGMISSDALILGERFLTDYKEKEPTEPDTFSSAGAFVRLDKEKNGETVLELLGIADKMDEYEFLRLDSDMKKSETGNIYGIRIDNLANIGQIAIMDYQGDKEEGKEYEEVFYLFLNPSSVNIGQFSNKKKAADENKQAIFCLKVFLELYGKR